jgi:hypothetical protein
VPAERYRLLLDWILAGEPDGAIALPPTTSDASTPGQSAVGTPPANR